MVNNGFQDLPWKVTIYLVYGKPITLDFDTQEQAQSWIDSVKNYVLYAGYNK